MTMFATFSELQRLCRARRLRDCHTRMLSVQAMDCSGLDRIHVDLSVILVVSLSTSSSRLEELLVDSITRFLTRGMRVDMFQPLTNQDIAFFDG